jgi:GntR family transcriptional regulator, rspAB operon transcriptional repressor
MSPKPKPAKTKKRVKTPAKSQTKNERAGGGNLPVSVAGRGITASAHILTALRREIMAMQRKPGEAIVERDIAAQYGVSRTPVREAILRLADEGLIEIFPQSGTFVSLIPLNAFHETVVIRKALEETTSRLAAERASTGQVKNIYDLVDWMREMEAKGERDQFHQADEAFHAAIAEAAGHPGIWNLVQQTKMQVDRYRRLTLPQEGRMTRVVKEHSAIATAIGAHSPERATEAMSKHLDKLLIGLGDIQDLNPEYFSGSIAASAPPQLPNATRIASADNKTRTRKSG